MRLASGNWFQKPAELKKEEIAPVQRFIGEWRYISTILHLYTSGRFTPPEKDPQVPTA
jgi:hypothetical protein